MPGRRVRRVASSSVSLLLFALSSCSSPRRVSAATASWPVCDSFGPPVMLGTSALSFCDMVTGVSCCGAAEDEALREEFQAMMSGDAPNDDAACSTIIKENLCAKCIPSSSPLPFHTPTSSESIPHQCLSSPGSPQQVATICLENLGGEGSFVDMAAHPDGSQRAFFSTQDGKIWLLSIPAHGSRGTLPIPDGAISPFLDLTGPVVQLMGAAFHPEFAANGRFFVSYSCDTTSSPACMVSSPPAGTNGSSPSQYRLVVAEFSAAKKATLADRSSEVRRIFTMDVPQPQAPAYSSYQQQAGQILFRPSDGWYLYLMTGYGLGEEANHEQFNNNNNTATSFLGKILRFNVDRINGQSGGSSSGPSTGDGSAGTTTPIQEPEIFAAGLNNPRGCSFDSARPSYMFCATVDEQNESVYLLGGPSANAASLVVGYSRAVSGTDTPSIVGGLVYRGSADPSLKGRYLYKYGVSAWAAVETPESSGRYVSAPIPNTRCSTSSPAPCVGGGEGSIDGHVVSFGEDNSGDAFVLATGGVYRVVEPGLCRAPRSRSSSAAAAALRWLLSAGACALAFAFYVFWKVFASGQQRAPNCGGDGWFRCLAIIVCSCCNCFNTVTNIHGPGAGSQAGLQLA